MKNGSLCLKILLSLIPLLFIAFGVWIILMAINDNIPVDSEGNPTNPIIVYIFGAVFCVSGILGFLSVLVSGSSRGPAIKAGAATAILVLSGLIFLSIAIVVPEEIELIQSASGVEVSRSSGGWVGQITFGVAGVLPIVFARQLYRYFKKHI